MATDSSGCDSRAHSAHARPALASAISTRRANSKSMNFILMLRFRNPYRLQHKLISSVSVPFVPGCLMNDLPLALHFLREFGIRFPSLKIHLRFQLAIVLKPTAFQLPGLDGAFHGATRLAAMIAIAKFATHGKLFNIFEGFLQSFLCLPKLNFSHSRCVDQDGAARQKNHLARCGCMPPFIISIANGLYAKLCRPARISSTLLMLYQSFDDACLADSRRPNQRPGFSAQYVGRDNLDALALACAHRMNGNSWRHHFHFGGSSGWIDAKV